MKLTATKDQNIFFTSDTHYNHKNICRSVSNWRDEDGNVPVNQTRDFKSLDHMNDYIVNSINSKVGENDILFHLGDWSFGGFDNIKEFRDRIICKNVHIVLGNHDHHILKNKDNIRDIFSSVSQYLDLTIVRPSNGRFSKRSTRFICMHFPIASWDSMERGVFHLHGHLHLQKGKHIHNCRSMDVGCEGNDLTPVNYNDIIFNLCGKPSAILDLGEYSRPNSEEIK